ncbi:MAG: metallophosphoesterase [Myxococcales bacterium]|nr:metallophosphoesterase [Myxococcales bacterium]MCB9715718.1 metallophosphoesterase [Myxococcales bacterium]
MSYAATVWGAYLALVLGAFLRNRVFGVFAVVILLFPAGVGLALRDHLGWLAPAIPYFQVAAAVQIALLMWRPRMKPWPVRLLLSWPASWFIAATFLAFPWAIAAAFGLTPHGAWIPFAIAAGGLAQSLVTRETTVDLRLRPERDAGELRRFGEGLGAPTQPDEGRPLTIVQITDPHLGAFMSVERLRRICQRAVDRQPDLILVTGDLMTMESHDVETVSRALEPLRAYEGRVFACHGNHDHEAREVVRIALSRNGVQLLVDDAALVETAAGPVQIVGSDFVWGRRRDAHLRALCDEHPRVPGALRVVLLHDPGAFTHLPEGEGDLVLSGHTHGGQVGLVSLGLRGTVVSALTKVPDHGPWARGRDRLYVHRAQGHYGFPIRLGVPAEQSLLRVWT